MAETDHPRGTCGLFCPYCAVGLPRNLEAVREYERQMYVRTDAAFDPNCRACDLNRVLIVAGLYTAVVLWNASLMLVRLG